MISSGRKSYIRAHLYPPIRVELQGADIHSSSIVIGNCVCQSCLKVPPKPCSYRRNAHTCSLLHIHVSGSFSTLLILKDPNHFLLPNNSFIYPTPTPSHFKMFMGTESNSTIGSNITCELSVRINASLHFHSHWPLSRWTSPGKQSTTATWLLNRPLLLSLHVFFHSFLHSDSNTCDFCNGNTIGSSFRNTLTPRERNGILLGTVRGRMSFSIREKKRRKMSWEVEVRRMFG